MVRGKLISYKILIFPQIIIGSYYLTGPDGQRAWNGKAILLVSSYVTVRACWEYLPGCAWEIGKVMNVKGKRNRTARKSVQEGRKVGR